MMGTMMENLPNGDSVSGDRCVLRTCNRAMHEWTEQQSDDVTFRHKQHDLWRAVRMFCEQVVAKAEQNVRNMLHGEISPLSQCTAVDTNASSDLGSGSAGRRTEETNVHLSSVSDRCVNKGAIHPAARLGVPDRCKGEVDFNLAACMDVTDGCAIWAESPGRSNEEECAQNIHDVENDAREVKGAHEERVQDALEKVLCGEAKKRDEKKQIQEIRREEEKDKNEEVEEGKKEDKKDSLPTPTATEECTNERNPRPATRTNTTDRRARDETDHASTRTHTSDRYLAEGRGYPSLTTCADATIGSHRQSATLVEKKGVRTSQSLKLRPEHKCANWNQDPAKPLPRHRSMELCGSKTRHATSPPVLQTSLTRGTAAHESHRTAMLDACVTNASLREHSLPLRNAAHHFDTHWMAALSPRTASGKAVNEHPSGKYTVAEEDGCRLVSNGESREDEVDEHGDLASTARDSMQCDVQEKTGFKKCLALLDEMDDSANSMELCEAIRACRSRVEAACCPPNSDEDSGLGSCTSSASDGADFFDAQECATAFDVTVPSEARVASSHTLTDISSTTLSSPKPQAVFQLPQYVPHSTTARTNTPAAASIPRSHPRGRSGRVLPPAPVYAEWLGPPASSSRISPAVSPVSSHDPDGHEELDCAEGRHIELDSCMENKDDYKDCRDTQLNLRMHAENQEPRDNENNRYNDNNYNNDNNDNNDKNDISDKNDNNDNNEKNNENNGNNKNNDDNDNNDNNDNDNAARCDDHQHENEDGPNNSINRIFPLAKNNVTNEDEAGVCRLIAQRDRCMAVGALDPATVETKSAPKQKHFDGFTRKLTPATRAPSCVDTANPTGDYAPVAERGSNFTVDELYAPLDEIRHSSQPLLYPDTVKQSLLEPGPAIHDTRNSRDHTSTHVTRNEHQRAEGDSPRAEPYKQAHTRGASHVPRKESRIRESSPPRPHLRRTHAHQSQMRIDDLFHRELSETVESRHGVPRAERVFSPASPQKKTDTNALRNPEKDIRPATVRGNDVECLTSDPFASLYALGDARSRRALAPPTQPTRGAAPQQVDHPQEQPYGEVKAPSLVPGPEDEPWDPLAAEIEDDEESYIKQAHREVAALHGGYQFDFHEVELDDLLTNFDSRKAQQREEYELIEQCRRKSDDDLLMMYYDAVLHNRPLGPTLQDFEDRHSINFTDEYLATYLVQKVIGDVIIAQADIEWTETKNDEQSLENLIAEYPLIDQVCDVETEWDIANLEQIASSKNIFNFWAFLLDDLYTSVILPAVQQDADPRGRIENDARVRHVLESPFCAASLIQFVVLIEAPHSCQQPEEAVLRSKVALDILIVHEFANLIFSNQLLRISDVMFMCFSSIESKSLGPRVVSSHVAGLISYVYSIAPDDVISFIHNFQSSMYMLAYYIHLPGIADLCLRLILQTSDLRPVRIAGQITQPYFLEFIVRIRWFPYLINVMSDRGTDSSKLKEAAILQFFNRFFEICEIHFRSIQKDAVTSTRLYSLVHYVAVETGLTQHLLDMGLATASMEAINVVLAILKIHPLVEGSADQVGCVLHAIFRPEMSVASPSRSRDDPEKYHDQRRALKNWGASACKSHRKTRVGAFECAQLQIIKVHLEEVKSLAWVPHDYWFLFQSWYLEREKRNHVCHPILFAIWKHFVLYAPLDVASEVLPQLIQDCMDIILAENWKDWCDLVKEPKSQKSIVAGCEITRVTHSVRFTSVGRRNGGLGTMLQFILFVAETNFLVDRGTGSSNKEMNRIRKVVGSAAFEACHQRAKEIQETTARATALALDKKRRPPSTSSTDPTVEPCEADPRTKLIDPPSISPPEPPQQQSMVALAFVDSPPWLVETRSCSAVEADESFRSGLCRLSVEDSCKYARRCEASSSNVTLSDISAELEAFEQRLQCRHVDAVDHCGIRGFHHDESIDAPLSSEEIPSPTSTATPPHSPHSDTHSSHSPTDVVHDVTLDDDDHLLRKLSPRSDGVKLALEGFVARCVENAIDAIPLRRTEKTPLAKTSVVELTIGPENASRNDVA